MNFTELEVWKASRAFQKDIWTLCKTFPSDEKYRLTDQLIRSSRSIAANIAEGHGRFHFQENIQYCRIARGSLSESLSHLYVALDCAYFSKEDFDRHEKTIEKLSRMLNGYMKYLKSQKK